MEKHIDVAIIGAGTAGLTALSMVRQQTDNFLLINGGNLGTTCARVGCMPSKVMIQVAEDFHRRHVFELHGIVGEENMAVEIHETMAHVRDLRDTFVNRVISNSTAKLPPEKFLEGYARFLDPHTLEVNEEITVRAKSIIIATGSRPIVPVAWEAFRDRIMTTDELFDQEDLPAAMAVIGLGVIGLELGQTLHRLGIQVTGVDLGENIGGVQDPEVLQAARDIIGKEFPLWLGHAATVTEENGKLRVSAGDNSVLVDKILASLGRVPNIESLALENLGLELNQRGLPPFNPHTLQVGDLPIFIAGDVSGDRAILHEAGHEGRIAAFNATRPQVRKFKRKTPLAITFCDPNIATIGCPWSELDLATTAIGEIRFAPVGRALIMGNNKGVLRVYADKRDGRLLGASMIGPRGENLAHLLAWSIEQNLSVYDLLNMPYYHPVIEESLQAALYNVLPQLEQQPDLPVELRLLE
jgi:dihydrolipoamide dehydrogenase